MSNQNEQAVTASGGVWHGQIVLPASGAAANTLGALVRTACGGETSDVWQRGIAWQLYKLTGGTLADYKVGEKEGSTISHPHTYADNYELSSGDYPCDVKSLVDVGIHMVDNAAETVGFRVFKAARNS